MARFERLIIALFFLSLIAACSVTDRFAEIPPSLFIPKFQRSDIIGFLAGLGTTLPPCRT